MTFFLEDNNNEEVDFNGEILTFTLQMIKTWTNMFFVLWMSFPKFKSDSYCVGGRHWSATKNIYGDITSKGSKILIGFCSKCQRKKSMTVSDYTIEAESLSDFFKNLGKTSVKVVEKLAKNVLKNTSLALDNTANIATTAASRSPKNVLSTLPEIINFYHTGKGLYLGMFVYIFIKNGPKNR